MNYIVILICLLAGVCWWYFTHHYLKMTAKKHLVYMLLIMAIAGALFPLYEYGIIKMIRYIVLMMAMVLIAIIDKEKMIIPNKILLILLGIRGILLIIECILNINSGLVKELILAPVLGFLFGGGLFMLCYLITRKGIGAGDVKLFAVIGAYVGPGVLFPIMILATFFSAVWGIALVALKKIKMKDSMPFGPFAAVATIVALLIGF